MNNTIYTFWEGKMPEYLKLCLDTWKFNFIVLNYDNIERYTDKLPIKLKQFTLPKIADYVRVHVLRDNGGYWLDTDTILLTDDLPEETILGDNEIRTNTIGYLHTEKNTELFIEWAKYQEYAVKSAPNMIDMDITRWDFLGNAFTDPYLKKHTDIKIGCLSNRWPETTMITDNIPRQQKYIKLYFQSNYEINDFGKRDMLMLHNSWTPAWYKNMSRDELLSTECTISNILRSTIKN